MGQRPAELHDWLVGQEVQAVQGCVEPFIVAGERTKTCNYVANILLKASENPFINILISYQKHFIGNKGA